MAAYGHPRYTGDLDFWIGFDLQNAQRLLKTLDQFGFGGLGIRLENFTSPNQVISLGYPPGRIDLLTSIDGVDFAVCYARRMVVPVDGVELSFIAMQDFRVNKRAVGRLQDLADFETLDRLMGCQDPW